MRELQLNNVPEHNQKSKNISIYCTRERFMMLMKHIKLCLNSFVQPCADLSCKKG